MSARLERVGALLSGAGATVVTAATLAASAAGAPSAVLVTQVAVAVALAGIAAERTHRRARVRQPRGVMPALGLALVAVMVGWVSLATTGVPKEEPGDKRAARPGGAYRLANDTPRAEPLRAARARCASADARALRAERRPV